MHPTDLTEMPHQAAATVPYGAPHRAEEMGMFYTALCLSIFGAAYAFLVSLTIF